MKRLHRTTSETVKPIYAGIRVVNKQVSFNWDSDSQKEDVIHLVEDSSGTFDSDNVQYFYAYSFVPGVDHDRKAIVRNYLKCKTNPNLIYSENLEDFVDRGVTRLDSFCSLSSFTVTVKVASTSNEYSLTDLMGSYIFEYSSRPPVNFDLIKKMYADVQFDRSAAFNALIKAGYTKEDALHEVNFTVKKFDGLKKSDQLFQMKRFIPKEIRSAFYDFLKFASEEEAKLYRLLQGVDVLVYDDFLTSGATVKEIIRYLRSVNPNNTLTVFVLVKQ